MKTLTLALLAVATLTACAPSEFTGTQPAPANARTCVDSLTITVTALIPPASCH